MSAELTAVGVTVRFGARTVVREASLALRPGRLTAIVGPNGAGKSSFLRALAGLVPFAGSIALGAVALGALRPAERARRIAYLPQGHEVHWPLAVRSVVALGRWPHGAQDPDRLGPADADAVAAAMRASDVTHLADRAVTTLSGGERARVALARVLAVGAEVVLADEPTASLDPRHQLDVVAALRDLARAGTAVGLVTHDLGLAARFADRVAVFREGILVVADELGAALAPEILSEVFGVASIRFLHEGEPVLVPWR